MCGFAGFTGRLDRAEETIKKMTDRIIHRGPDMAGFYTDEKLSLGFRRLSIIDLSEACSQPMQTEDGNFVLVFNGEIYNFMELREELVSRGHSFITKGDTEVLLRAYIEYGEAVVDRLRGMFAFVIYDKQQDKLFGARDFFGIKPFYYTKTESGELIFGSEIKSFLEHPQFVKEVNKDALLPYLTFQYSSLDETFFKGVYKLPPAHCFSYKDGRMDIRRYWDIEFKSRDAEFEETVERLHETVRHSVEAHRISDVAVGTFLSGGVDSSYITASMMPDDTFSVGFELSKKFNETDYAKQLSDILKIKNYKKLITADECFEAFSDIQYHMDEPQSNPSSVPLYFLAKLASEHVTVVLSGEGADEIFAGYEWYDETPLMKKYKKLPGFIRRAAASAAKRLPYFKGHDFIIKSSGVPEDYFIGQALVYPEKEARAIVSPSCKNGLSPKQVTAEIYNRVKDSDELTKKQYLDLNLWLPGDILLKADKMSMAHSLELRVPFLDKEVMAMAQEIPASFKINGKNTKYVLRRAAAKLVPEEWAERTKVGFPVPIRFWLREQKYYDIVKAHFTADYAAEFFDCQKINALLDRHFKGEENNGRKIWTVFTFLVWYKRFFVDEK